MINNLEMGPRIREERERLDLSQTGVAEAIGISKPTQIAYERGVRSPDLGYLTELEALGFDWFYVLTGKRLEEFRRESIDWKRAELALKQIHAEAARRKIKLTAEKEAVLLRMVYEEASDEGAKNTLIQGMRLVA